MTLLVISLITALRFIYNAPLESGIIAYPLSLAPVVPAFLALILMSKAPNVDLGRHSEPYATSTFCFAFLTPIFAPITTGVVQLITTIQLIKRWFAIAQYKVTRPTKSVAVLQGAGLAFITFSLILYAASFSPFPPLSIALRNQASILFLIFIIFSLAILTFEFDNLSSVLSLISAQCVIILCMFYSSGYFMKPDPNLGISQTYSFEPKEAVGGEAALQGWIEVIRLRDMLGLIVVLALTGSTLLMLFYYNFNFIAKWRSARFVMNIHIGSLVTSFLFIFTASFAYSFLYDVDDMLIFVTTETLTTVEYAERHRPGWIDVSNPMVVGYLYMVLLAVSPGIATLVTSYFFLHLSRDAVLKLLDTTSDKRLLNAWDRRIDREPKLRLAVWYVTSIWSYIAFAAAGTTLYLFMVIDGETIQDFVRIIAIVVRNSFD